MNTTKDAEVIVCNLCGQDNAATLFITQGRRIVRCRACGLVYINPWISERGLYFYQDATYFAERNRYLARQEEFRHIFSNILDQVEKYRQNGRLLDVGCGPGLLLDVARTRGWTVTGIEISEWAARYAQEELGLSVICGELSNEQFSATSFDVIIANHSLEHMPDPSDALQIMRRLLKEDGVLVIGVPNFGSLMAKLRGARWCSLLPEQHRWHFTPRTLTQMLNKAGFEVFDITFENHEYGGNLTKKLILGSISWLSLKLHRGEAMLVLVQKS